MVTAKDKLACARRELAMRRKAYPNWIQQRRMTQVDADREIEIMAAIVADYQREAGVPDLFDGGNRNG